MDKYVCIFIGHVILSCIHFLVEVVKDAWLYRLGDQICSGALIWLLYDLLSDLISLSSILDHLLLAARDLVAHDVYLILEMRLKDSFGLVNLLPCFSGVVLSTGFNQVIGSKCPINDILPWLSSVYVSGGALWFYLVLEQLLMILWYVIIVVSIHFFEFGASHWHLADECFVSIWWGWTFLKFCNLLFDQVFAFGLKVVWALKLSTLIMERIQILLLKPIYLLTFNVLLMKVIIPIRSPATLLFALCATSITVIHLCTQSVWVLAIFYVVLVLNPLWHHLLFLVESWIYSRLDVDFVLLSWLYVV